MAFRIGAGIEYIILTWSQDGFGYADSFDAGAGRYRGLRGGASTGKGDGTKDGSAQPAKASPKRFHGTATVDAARVGRDAGKIAEEVISHLVAQVGATVTVTIEIEGLMPNGAPDNVVRTATENARTLKFTNQGFEKE